MNKKDETIYRARYIFDVVVRDDSTPDGSRADLGGVEVFFDCICIASERNLVDEAANDIFDYVEEWFPEEMKVLYSHLMYWEGTVHTEYRPNMRRHYRKMVLDLLDKNDDFRRRIRLLTAPPKIRKQPNLTSDEEKDRFVDEIQRQMSEMTASSIPVTRKNLGLKRYIERLRNRLEKHDFKSTIERRNAQELVANYDADPRMGDVIENPWKSLGQEFKKYAITFEEIKSKLNRNP